MPTSCIISCLPSNWLIYFPQILALFRVFANHFLVFLAIVFINIRTMRTLRAVVSLRSGFFTRASLSPSARHISSLVVTHSRFCSPDPNSRLTNASSINFRLQNSAFGRSMSPVAGQDPACGNGSIPGYRLYWNWSSKEIASKTDELIAKSRTIYDAVGDLSKTPEKVTVDSVLKVS